VPASFSRRVMLAKQASKKRGKKAAPSSFISLHSLKTGGEGRKKGKSPTNPETALWTGEDSPRGKKKEEKSRMHLFLL